MNLNEHLEGFAIGVRFRPNFTIEDNSGRILDKVLYGKESYFGPSFFPESITSGEERVLLNKKKGYQLRLNHSNIVLDINLTKDWEKNEINKCIRKYKQEIIEAAFEDVRITDIVRIGFVKKYVFKDEQLIKEMREKFKGVFGEVDEFHANLTKRIPDQEAAIKEGVNDYYNAILQISRNPATNYMGISVDYQHLFQPYLEKLNQLRYDSFIERVEAFNERDITKWLEEMVRK